MKLRCCPAMAALAAFIGSANSQDIRWQPDITRQRTYVLHRVLGSDPTGVARYADIADNRLGWTVPMAPPSRCTLLGCSACARITITVDTCPGRKTAYRALGRWC